MVSATNERDMFHIRAVMSRKGDLSLPVALYIYDFSNFDVNATVELSVADRQVYLIRCATHYRLPFCTVPWSREAAMGEEGPRLGSPAPKVRFRGKFNKSEGKFQYFKYKALVRKKYNVIEGKWITSLLTGRLLSAEGNGPDFVGSMASSMIPRLPRGCQEDMERNFSMLEGITPGPKFTPERPIILVLGQGPRNVQEPASLHPEYDSGEALHQIADVILCIRDEHGNARFSCRVWNALPDLSGTLPPGFTAK